MESYVNGGNKKMLDIVAEKIAVTKPGDRICVTGVMFGFIKDKFIQMTGERYALSHDII